METYKEVIVVPLAARREALALAGVILLIMLVMAVRFSAVRVTVQADSLKPYQRKDIALKNQAPLLYRSLRGVTGDIIDLREESGQWPEVELLQDEALPPFAAEFLPVGLRGYVWTRHVGPGWVDYFGVYQEVSAAIKKGLDPLEDSFMLRIIDLRSESHPHPHEISDNDAARSFSSQVWMYPGRRSYPGENVAAKGWKWIVSSSDEKIYEKPGE